MLPNVLELGCPFTQVQVLSWGWEKGTITLPTQGPWAQPHARWKFLDIHSNLPEMHLFRSKALVFFFFITLYPAQYLTPGRQSVELRCSSLPPLLEGTVSPRGPEELAGSPVITGPVRSEQKLGHRLLLVAPEPALPSARSQSCPLAFLATDSFFL